MSNNEFLAIPSTYSVPVKTDIRSLLVGIILAGTLSLTGLLSGVLLFFFKSHLNEYTTYTYEIILGGSFLAVAFIMFFNFKSDFKKIRQIQNLTKGKEIIINENGLLLAPTIVHSYKKLGSWLPKESWNAPLNNTFHIELPWYQITGTSHKTVRSGRNPRKHLLVLHCSEYEVAIDFESLGIFTDTLAQFIQSKKSGRL
jgi:hypothetical protein